MTFSRSIRSRVSTGSKAAGPDDHVRAAEQQRRQSAGQAGDVEQRRAGRGDPVLGVPAEVRHLAERVHQQVAVGQHRALGPAGRARRVHDERGLVLVDDDVERLVPGRGQRRLVLLADDQDRRDGRRLLARLGGDPGERGVDDEGRRAASRPARRRPRRRPAGSSPGRRSRRAARPRGRHSHASIPLSARTATRSPAPTPRCCRARASRVTRSSSSAYVRPAPSKRSATTSGLLRACRASWSLMVIPRPCRVGIAALNGTPSTWV